MACPRWDVQPACAKKTAGDGGRTANHAGADFWSRFTAIALKFRIRVASGPMSNELFQGAADPARAVPNGPCAEGAWRRGRAAVSRYGSVCLPALQMSRFDLLNVNLVQGSRLCGNSFRPRRLLWRARLNITTAGARAGAESRTPARKYSSIRIRQIHILHRWKRGSSFHLNRVFHECARVQCVSARRHGSTISHRLIQLQCRMACPPDSGSEASCSLRPRRHGPARKRRKSGSR